MNSMKEKVLIDSNVWVYLASNQDKRKKQIARDLVIKNYDLIILSVQILGEVFTVLERKTDLTKREVANITTYYAETYELVNSNLKTFIEAVNIKLKYGFSFFDSLIVSTAIINECTVLYTEDLQHNQLIENKLRIINPFKNK